MAISSYKYICREAGKPKALETPGGVFINLKKTFVILQEDNLYFPNNVHFPMSSVFYSILATRLFSHGSQNPKQFALKNFHNIYELFHIFEIN